MAECEFQSYQILSYAGVVLSIFCGCYGDSAETFPDFIPGLNELSSTGSFGWITAGCGFFSAGVGSGGSGPGGGE